MGTLPSGGTLHSPALGLELTVRGRALRLVDEATGHLLPTGHDEAESARAEAQAARSAATDARKAETAARAAEQRAQAEAEARQAAEQRAQAEAEARQAAEVRAKELEDELARLRARLHLRNTERE
jgi:hypothetical protein